MQYQTILFDLDGTLTDSAPGIVNAARYALERFGMEAEPAVLRSFIGPPLCDSFHHALGMPLADARRAVKVFQEYFRDRGIFENAPYPGIVEMLKSLHGSGKRLVVATSKPELFAERIAERFGFSPWLDGVFGADMEETRVSKGEIIRYALHSRGIDPASAVMVGDRKYDIDGARQSGVDGIGVLYGYGSHSELEAAGAMRIVSSVDELGRILH